MAIIILRDNKFRAGFMVEEVKQNIDLEPKIVQKPFAAEDIAGEVIIGQAIMKEDVMVLLDAKKMIAKSRVKHENKDEL